MGTALYAEPDDTELDATSASVARAFRISLKHEVWHRQRKEPDKAKLKPRRLHQMLRILGEVTVVAMTGTATSIWPRMLRSTLGTGSERMPVSDSSRCRGLWYQQK